MRCCGFNHQIAAKSPQSCKTIESDWTGVVVPALPTGRESPREWTEYEWCHRGTGAWVSSSPGRLRVFIYFLSRDTGKL